MNSLLFLFSHGCGKDHLPDQRCARHWHLHASAGEQSPIFRAIQLKGGFPPFMFVVINWGQDSILPIIVCGIIRRVRKPALHQAISD